MADEDLFPGFRTERIPGEDATIFCRIGGSGPPVLFLHGFPQTHVIWHRMATELARHFTCVFADLRGYGDSSPPSEETPLSYSKRAMGSDMVAVMRHLGHQRFALVGHDRGGRVAYRLALDNPGCLSRFAVLDILSTFDYWQKVDRQFGQVIYHWMFLAQPYPLPEALIGAAPDTFLERELSSRNKSKDLSVFDARALSAYRRQIHDPVRLHAMCEDYRAGASVDYDHDAVDRQAGKQISVPMLALWGSAGIAAAGETPVDVWKRWAPDVRGQGVDGGHYVPEEAPDETLAVLVPFLRDH